MSPPNSFDEKPIVIKSKRGRKSLTVSEGHIDVTGRTHVMTVRRSNPPIRKKKTMKPKTAKPKKKQNKNDDRCRRCEQNDQYINTLNDRINKLESLVEKLTSNNDNATQPQAMVPQVQNFSSMETDELLNLSNQVGIVLFERFEMQNQIQLQASMVTQITTVTSPVNSFEVCENVDSTVPDWNAFTPFTQYQ